MLASTSAAGLLAELGRLTVLACASSERLRFPTTDPNRFYHALDCNLHTLTAKGFKHGKVQRFAIKGAARLQYVSDKPHICFFLDETKGGSASLLVLDFDLQQKEHVRYATLDEAESSLKARIGVLERRLGRPISHPTPPQRLPALEPEQAVALWDEIAGVAEKGGGPKSPAVQQLPAQRAEYRALALDAAIVAKALRGGSQPVVRLLRAVSDEQSLDRWAAGLAVAAVEGGLKAAVKWLLLAATALGGDVTAAVLGEALWQKLFESHGHAQVTTLLGALKSIGTLRAAQEIYAAEAMPSRYMSRRNEARQAFAELAAAHGMEPDELAVRSVPASVTSAVRERIERVHARRLETMMVDGIRFPFHQLGELYRGHPILGALAARVVWGAYGSGDVLFASFLPGEAAGVRAEDRVGIAHPIELGEVEVARWRDVFKTAKLAQPFLQLERTTYELSAAQRETNELRNYKRYRREWLHELGWWGFKQDSDYISDVDTFAVEMKRDGKHIEAALDAHGLIHKVGMGHVAHSYDYPKDGYTAPADDPMPFGKLHPVSRSELLYAFLGQRDRPPTAPAALAPALPAAPSGRPPFVEKAKSSRSACVVCGEKIEKDSLRIGVERMIDTGSFRKLGTAFLHAATKCIKGCSELKDLPNLDAQLTRTSPGLWPPK